MLTATRGSRVKVNYTVWLENGKRLQPLSQDDTVEFVLGTGSVLRGFEMGVRGMCVGEVRILKIPPRLAYGSRRPEKVFRIERAQVRPQAEPLKPGDAVRIGDDLGKDFFGIVSGLDEHGVVVDANHPLADQHVTFEIHLLEIHPPHEGSAEDSSSGQWEQLAADKGSRANSPGQEDIFPSHSM